MQKSLKANYGFLDSLKKRTKLTILSKEDSQDREFYSFFRGTEDTIDCFRDLLTFNVHPNPEGHVTVFELIFVLVVHTLLPLYICSRVTSFGIRHSLHAIRSIRTVCEYIKNFIVSGKLWTKIFSKSNLSILIAMIFESAFFWSAQTSFSFNSDYC